jgi:hypothetical protein
MYEAWKPENSFVALKKKHYNSSIVQKGVFFKEKKSEYPAKQGYPPFLEILILVIY